MRGSLYSPGQSWLHRLKAGRKLLALAMLGVVLMMVHSLPVLAAVLFGVIWLTYRSGVSVSRLWRQLRTLFWFMLFLGLYSAWVQSPEAAAEMLLRLSSLILMALLVSLTTPITQMMEVMESVLEPFSRLGWVDVSQVSLAFGLTLRLIPELSLQWDEIREAQMARGIKPGVLTMLFPMLVRTLRRAQEISEAIDARAVNSSAVK
ncbi:MAG: energy-coupling factor transporter transmembrane protein EcfT [Sheuella sp.]|nr:energy-coupling factor transporter transmembrane protein EcfT [Sheuella sp.]